MNTIERVARGICEADTGGLNDNELARCHGLAKAALEALCEGLEWQGYDLHYNGLKIGTITASNKVKGVWRLFVCGKELEVERMPGSFDWAVVNDPFSDHISILKAAGLQAARKWIMGVETVTEKG